MRTLWILAAVLVAAFLSSGCGSEKKQAQGSAASQMKSAQQTQTAMTQTMCPVMNQPVNREIYTDYKGKRIYFCCPSCVETFKKDPEKYMQKMMDEGVHLEDAPAGEMMGGGMQGGQGHN